MRHLLVLTALAPLALTACGIDRDDGVPDDATSSAMDEAVANPDAPVTAEDAAMPKKAQGFADSVATSDKYELDAAALAATMAVNPAVKDFAAMMTQAHTASSAELKAVTARMTPPLTPAVQVDPEMDADIAALKSAGAGFDALFVQKQVAAHQKALALLQGYANGGDDQSLKDFAAKAAGTVQKHLAAAQALKP